MDKNIIFRANEDEWEHLDTYCRAVRRSKSDVLRELVRSLEIPTKVFKAGRKSVSPDNRVIPINPLG